jgi:heme exporter protein CcmD
MKDYTAYIAAAYGICFIVLAAVTLTTLLQWRRYK